jgi:hypothetical protein
MGALKLHTLKQKLWAIVAASFIARVIMFFTLPNTPSSLAPDEITYAYYATEFSKQDFTSIIYRFFDVELLGRTLVLPSSLLVKLGLPSLDAIRVVSSLYSLISLILLSLAIHKFFIKSDSSVFIKHEKFMIFVIFIYAFWPSRFIWSVLGLRESTMELGVIIALVSTSFLISNRATIWSLGIILGLVFVFLTRPQVGWLLFIAEATCLFLVRGVKHKFIFLLSLLIGVMCGYFLTTPFESRTQATYEAKIVTPSEKPAPVTPSEKPAPVTPSEKPAPVTPSEKPAPVTPSEKPAPVTPSEKPAPVTPSEKPAPVTPSEKPAPVTVSKDEATASTLCQFDEQQVSSEGNRYVCSQTNSVTETVRKDSPLESIVGNVDAIPYAQEVRAIDAQSAIQQMACVFESNSKISDYLCIAWRMPYMSFTFLFRPMLIIDTTSSASSVAAMENLIWLALFLLVAIGVARKPRKFVIKPLIPIYTFVILYVLGAGSYQGNLGTAFRHKSLILGGLLLLVYLTVSFQRQKDTHEVSTS